jgi:hypothetical protein
MASLQSVAERDDVVVVCSKPFSTYAGLDILLARIHADGRFEVLSAEPMVLDVRCKGAAPLRMRWHRRFDHYADAVYIAGQRDAGANQAPDKKRANASDSTFNAV